MTRAFLPTPNWFVDPTVERLSQQRSDPVWLAAQMAHPDTRFVVTWRSGILTSAGPRPRFLAPQELGDLAGQAAALVLLGAAHGHTYFAIDLPAGRDEATLAPFHNLRALAPLVERWEGALLAHAVAMAHWHHTQRFCGLCGSPTASENAGHLRVCTNAECARHHFPRMDPAIIVLVTSGGRCLLGRQAVWPRAMYSTLAGFVEPGESLEAAVAREVREETGVPVERVRYHSSQPWPFPCSLMLGFTARATHTAIHLNDGELEDARWVSRRDVQIQLERGELSLPSPFSISFHLIEDWFDGEDKGRLRRVLAQAH